MQAWEEKVLERQAGRQEKLKEMTKREDTGAGSGGFGGGSGSDPEDLSGAGRRGI